MKTGRKMILVSALVVLSLARTTVRAEDQPSFKDDKEKASYALGVYFGNQIKGGNLDVDLEVVMSTVKEVMSGREAKLNPQQVRDTLVAYQTAARAKVAEKNRAEGEAFLAANKTKEGVQTFTATGLDGKPEEMQYKVITEGTGATPGVTDTVKVNYRGTLINGTEFDSSAKHGGKPAEFPVNHVIKGWTEALQKMKVGSKWQLFIPSGLAYGDRGGQGIEPASTLIFEVELVDAQAPAPAPEAITTQPKPLTSDIIRVPSAEEMKAGAKIEVIKASDLEKTNAANASKPK